MGDAVVGAKVAIGDDRVGDPLGLAIRGTCRFSAHPAGSGLRRSAPVLSGELVTTRHLGVGRLVSGVIGVESIPKGRDQYGAIVWAGGVAWTISDRFGVQGEVRGRVSVTGIRTPHREPVDLIAGPTIRVGEAVWIRPALSLNLTAAASTWGSVRSHAGLNLSCGWGAH